MGVHAQCRRDGLELSNRRFRNSNWICFRRHIDDILVKSRRVQAVMCSVFRHWRGQRHPPDPTNGSTEYRYIHYSPQHQRTGMGLSSIKYIIGPKAHTPRCSAAGRGHVVDESACAKVLPETASRCSNTRSVAVTVHTCLVPLVPLRAFHDTFPPPQSHEPL